MPNVDMIALHNSLPYLDEDARTYNGHGATLDRPAPKYVRSLAAWERAAQKVTVQTGLPYSSWTGPQFAAGTKIYKATFAKYGLNQPGPDQA